MNRPQLALRPAPCAPIADHTQPARAPREALPLVRSLLTFGFILSTLRLWE